MNRRTASISDPEALKAIVFAAVTSGSLYLIASFAKFYFRTGNNPMWILKIIASGVFADAALNGGTAILFWGLVFHFMISFGFSLLFFWIYPLWNGFEKNKLLTAAIFGILIWLLMTFVVVPLSNVPKVPMYTFQSLVAILILVFMVGVPITLIIGNFYAREDESY